jgi:ABC-2 type transport system permease protein
MRKYWLLLQWQLRQISRYLPMFVVLQTLLSAGMVVGFGFLIGTPTPSQAQYLVSGAPTLALLLMGLAAMPQLISQRKAEGQFEYIWSLPVPRMAYLAAQITVWIMIMLPGAVLAQLVARARYDYALDLTPVLLPAVLLVALTSAAIGFAIALISPHPMVVGVITQVLLIGVLLFSPINFPADRLPGWLAAIHQVLPIESLAQLVRGGLTGAPSTTLTGAFALSAAWCIGALGVSALAAHRRP